MTAPEIDAYAHHRHVAQQALREVDLQADPGGVSDRWLALAQVHATLALAAATRDNHPSCGVHCHAMGC